MWRASASIAVLAGACGGDPSGYAVSWRLTSNGQPTDCLTQRVAQVELAAIDLVTSDTRLASVPCIDGAGVVDGVDPGQHRIEARALGSFGEVAGDAAINGAVTDDGQIIDLPALDLPVLPPAYVLQADWSVQLRGQPATCAAVGADGVAIKVRPTSDAEYTDIFDCIDTVVQITDLPLGPFTARAELWDAQDRVLASSEPVSFAATRGLVRYEPRLNVQ